MNRPGTFVIDNQTLYWYVSIVDADGTPLDADSNITVGFRISNSMTVSSFGITVTKVPATTGLYRVAHNLVGLGNVMVNSFLNYEEIAIISGVTYYNRWTSVVRDVATSADVSAIKAKTDQLAFTVANQVDANSLTGGTSPSAVADAVWDEAYSAHKIAGTFGKLMDQLRKANQAIDGEIDGTSTATSLNTNVTGYTDEAFDSELVLFVSGVLSGESRPVLTYNGTTGVMTFEEPWTQAPVASDEFVILPAHIHSITKISQGVFDKFTDGSNEDLFKADVSGLATQVDVTAIKAKTDQFVFTLPNQVDANAITGGASPVAIADAIWDAIELDHQTPGSTGKALSDAGATGGSPEDNYNYFTALSRADAFKADLAAIQATTDQFRFTVTNQVDANALSGGTPVGPGGIATPVTIREQGAPVDGAAVWITTDLAGTNTVAGVLYTDAAGLVTFLLEAGTYYAWAQQSGINFNNPYAIVVTEG